MERDITQDKPKAESIVSTVLRVRTVPFSDSKKPDNDPANYDSHLC